MFAISKNSTDKRECLDLRLTKNIYSCAFRKILCKRARRQFGWTSEQSARHFPVPLPLLFIFFKVSALGYTALFLPKHEAMCENIASCFEKNQVQSNIFSSNRNFQVLLYTRIYLTLFEYTQKTLSFQKTACHKKSDTSLKLKY